MKSPNTPPPDPKTPPTPSTPTPDYATEAEARAAGWQAITTLIDLSTEAAIAESIRATLNGDAPGTRPVAFCLIGTPERFQFARRREDLRGVDERATTGSAEICQTAAA